MPVVSELGQVAPGHGLASARTIEGNDRAVLGQLAATDVLACVVMSSTMRSQCSGG
jgi:hypothetical protein